MEATGSTPSVPAARAERVAIPLSIQACIAATFFIRSASFAASVLLGLHLAYINTNLHPVSQTLVGLLPATFYLVEILGAPVSGVLGDRFGHRIFMLLGPITGAISAQILGLTSFIPLMFLVMAIKGVSSATSIPATLTYLSYSTRDSDAVRTRSLAWFEVATIAGAGIGGLLGGIFYGRLGPWAFTAVALMYLIAFVLLLSIARNEVPAGASAERSFADYFRLLRTPRLLTFIPAWACVNAIVGLWINHTPFLLKQAETEMSLPQLLQGGYSAEQVGLVFGAIGTLLGVGIIIWGNILAGRPRTIGMYAGVGGLAAMTVFMAFLNRSGSEWQLLQALLLIAVILAVMVGSGFTPAALTHLADIAEEQGEDRGAVMGLYSVFFGLGQVAGSLIGGVAGDRMGADGMIITTGIMVVIAFFSVRMLESEPALPAAKSH